MHATWSCGGRKRTLHVRAQPCAHTGRERNTGGEGTRGREGPKQEWKGRPHAGGAASFTPPGPRVQYSCVCGREGVSALACCCSLSPSSSEYRIPPMGAPNATATPAAQAAERISFVLAWL